jgi:hypothetical protein
MRRLHWRARVWNLRRGGGRAAKEEIQYDLVKGRFTSIASRHHLGRRFRFPYATRRSSSRWRAAKAPRDRKSLAPLQPCDAPSASESGTDRENRADNDDKRKTNRGAKGPIEHISDYGVDQCGDGQIGGAAKQCRRDVKANREHKTISQNVCKNEAPQDRAANSIEGVRVGGKPRLR